MAQLLIQGKPRDNTLYPVPDHAIFRGMTDWDVSLLNLSIISGVMLMREPAPEELPEPEVPAPKKAASPKVVAAKKQAMAKEVPAKKVKTKTCPHCGVTKPLAEFHRYPNRHYKSTCLACG